MQPTMKRKCYTKQLVAAATLLVASQGSCCASSVRAAPSLRTLTAAFVARPNRATSRTKKREMISSPRRGIETDGSAGCREEALVPVKMAGEAAAASATTPREENMSDDGSEDNSPRRGRPGLVVFSGGTAFNAASAEMASRAGRSDLDVLANGEAALRAEEEGDAISRSNSASSLVDLMAMASMEEEIARMDGNFGAGNKHHAALGGTKVWHVLPVTDDGGSTAEIVRVLGGPAVGDIRSRLLRLAPGTTREARAVRRLLGHRLVSMQSLEDDGRNGEEVTHEAVSRMAREEWLDILDGGHESYQQRNEDDAQQSYEHPLWKDVSAPYRSIIRAFLVHFHNQVLQTHNGIRQSQSHPPFDFTGGSVGNFFFAGARTFFGSLPAAIFLFSKVAGIPSGSRVIPAALSEERLVLGAELKDGVTRIRGQYNISHPKAKSVTQKSKPQSPAPQSSGRERSGSTSSASRHRQVVKKSAMDPEDLHPSPIHKMCFLLNDPTWRRTDKSSANTSAQWNDRHEISLEPNPLVLEAIENSSCIVYGCGSLFTSVIPSLILEGVGTAISSRKNTKVLLLNGWHDSETSWTEFGEDGERIVKQMDAVSIVQAVVDALDQGSHCADHEQVTPLVTDYITHIFFPQGTEISVNEREIKDLCAEREQRLQRRGHVEIQVRSIASIPASSCSEGKRSGGKGCHRVFDPHALVDELLGLANKES